MIVGEGDTYDATLQDMISAIQFHIETFDSDDLETDSPVLKVFLADADIAV